MLPVLERRRGSARTPTTFAARSCSSRAATRDMYGAILLPPYRDDADMAVLFMHNEGYSTMCGHGIDRDHDRPDRGRACSRPREPVTTIRFEVPAGIVAASARPSPLAGRRSWASTASASRTCPRTWRHSRSDVAPDGVELHGAAARLRLRCASTSPSAARTTASSTRPDLGLRVVPEQREALRRAGAAITDVLRRDHTPAHPTDPDLGFVYGTIIVDLDPAHLAGRPRPRDAHHPQRRRSSPTPSSTDRRAARARARCSPSSSPAAASGSARRSSTPASPASPSSAASRRETRLGDRPAVVTSVGGTRLRDRLLDVGRG